MTDTFDAWETASEQAEVSREAVAEAALRHVAASVLRVVPDAVFLEVSFGSFGDGLVAETLHVDGDVGELSELSEDVHDALDDLNEYNAGVWMPFVVEDDDDAEFDGVDADDQVADGGPPLLIDLTLVRERLG